MIDDILFSPIDDQEVPHEERQHSNSARYDLLLKPFREALALGAEIREFKTQLESKIFTFNSRISERVAVDLARIGELETKIEAKRAAMTAKLDTLPDSIRLAIISRFIRDDQG